MTTNDKPISPLRARMLDDMALRKLSPQTQAGYIRAVKKLAAHLKRSPDCASAEDLRALQLDMAQRGVSRTPINATLSGLRFFGKLRALLSVNPEPVGADNDPTADDTPPLWLRCPACGQTMQIIERFEPPPHHRGGDPP